MISLIVILTGLVFACYSVVCIKEGVIGVKEDIKLWKQKKALKKAKTDEETMDIIVDVVKDVEVEEEVKEAE